MLTIPIDFAAVIHQLRYTSDPEPMALTYAVGIDTSSPPTSAEALADAVADAFADNMLARLPAAVQLVQTEVTWQNAAPPADPVVGVSVVGAGAGTNGATALIPQNSAYLVHKRTNLGGRRGRGRMYFPGVAESNVDNLGNVLGAELVAWNASLSTWRADLIALPSVVGMALLHGPSQAVPPSPEPPPTYVSSLTLDPVIATQRRRLRR